MTDEEIERIHEEAQEAAIHHYPGRLTFNPYPINSEAYDIWEYAFRNAYAQENGK